MLLPCFPLLWIVCCLSSGISGAPAGTMRVAHVPSYCPTCGELFRSLYMRGIVAVLVLGRLHNWIGGIFCLPGLSDIGPVATVLFSCPLLFGADGFFSGCGGGVSVSQAFGPPSLVAQPSPVEWTCSSVFVW